MATSPAAAHSSGSSNESIWDKHPSLEQLVEHFLASKRSLSAITHVSRARELVDSGRQALEENAILSAQNAFVRHAIHKQIEAFDAIRYGASIMDAEGNDEFQRIIQALDTADARLKNTLDTLRQTIVEPSFRPPNDESKSLFDFVDEAGINDLYETIKQSIDRYDTARSTFKDVSATFDRDLDLIHGSLVTPQEEQEAERRMQSNGGSPIPILYVSLETHAAETAQNLESLVKHYDLCVTALKHTEGGGEAITKAGESEQQEQLEGFGVDLAQIEAEAALQPISATDRAGMLVVLQKDAAEVEDVVNEIKDRLAEMEEQFAQVMAYIQLLRGTAERLRNALQHVKSLSRNIHGCIAASSDFQTAWSEEKAVLQEKMEEVDSMVDLYSGFANAYDELILEAQRRRHVKHKMEKAIKETVKYLQQLYQDDMEHRETFRSEHADYIPADLWVGLLNPPPSYRFVIEDEEIAALPDISREVYEAALKRAKARIKPSVRPDA